MAVTLLKPATIFASSLSSFPHLATEPSLLIAQQEFPSIAMETTLLNPLGPSFQPELPNPVEITVLSLLSANTCSRRVAMATTLVSTSLSISITPLVCSEYVARGKTSLPHHTILPAGRSEERRVGKECRSRW